MRPGHACTRVTSSLLARRTGRAAWSCCRSAAGTHCSRPAHRPSLSGVCATTQQTLAATALPVNSGIYMKRGFFRFATLLLRISSSLLLPSDSPPGGARPPPAAALAMPALPLLPSCCGRCCGWCWPPPSKSPSSLPSSRRYRLAWARCFRKAAWAARCCICF